MLTKLFRNPYINLNCNSIILWLNLNYRKLLSTSFFYLLTYTDSRLLLGVMLQAVILQPSFFKSFVFLISIMPSHKFLVINSFRITIVKIIIIKISIMEGYTIMTYIFTVECNKIRV